MAGLRAAWLRSLSLMGSTAEEQARFLEEARAAGEQWAIDRILSEGPQHRVRITRPFYLGKYEVTQAQWEAVMGSNPSGFRNDPSHPVEQVNWDDVQAFLAKLNVAGTRRVPSANAPPDGAGLTFTLPTEAQWEYACRAGTTTRFSFGDDPAALGEYAWWLGNCAGTTHPVCEKRPNAWRLFDVHGNVWEWCADWYAMDYYARSPTEDPAGPDSGESRVLRGGSWNDDDPDYFRCAYRDLSDPDYRGANFGFRVARTVTP